MATTAEKKALWALIREEHPELARQLQAERSRPEPYVAIEGYPPSTTRWIRRAIAAHSPSLDSTIRDVMLPGKKALGMFEPKIEVKVEALIEALVAYEIVDNEERTAAAV